MKSLSIFLGIILAIGTIVFFSSSNVEKSRPNGYEFTADTLTESENSTFTIPQHIKNKTGYFWQITVAQDSFATDVVARLQESAWDTENRWYTRDTLAITAAGTYRFTGTTDAKRLQLYIYTDTTNSQVTVNTAVTLTEEF